MNTNKIEAVPSLKNQSTNMTDQKRPSTILEMAAKLNPFKTEMEDDTPYPQDDLLKGVMDLYDMQYVHGDVFGYVGSLTQLSITGREAIFSGDISWLFSRTLTPFKYEQNPFVLQCSTLTTKAFRANANDIIGFVVRVNLNDTDYPEGTLSLKLQRGPEVGGSLRDITESTYNITKVGASSVCVLNCEVDQNIKQSWVDDTLYAGNKMLSTEVSLAEQQLVFSLGSRSVIWSNQLSRTISNSVDTSILTVTGTNITAYVYPVFITKPVSMIVSYLATTGRISELATVLAAGFIR